MTHAGEGAFARPFSCDEGAKSYEYAQSGLTKREFFAASALQGISAQVEYSNAKDMAETAVQLADELIMALNKKKGNQ